jgi:pilus assembly protein CpaE
VIVLTYGSPNGFVRRVFEAGADDLIVLPQTPEDIRFAIMKAVARKAGAGSLGGDSGRIVVVLGPKGGTGKTLTSANLGVALADSGKRTAIVDLDLQFGDVALTLGLPPTATIHDLLSAGGSLDAAKLSDYMATHSSGLRVLLAPTRPDQAAIVTVAHLREIYNVLRGSFDYVVVDTPPGFTPEVIATIDAATDVCLIGTLDAPSLKNAKLGWETLQLMAYPPEQVRIVLNRADTSVGVSHADVVSVLGRAPDVLVPSHRDVVRSVNSGEPIVLSSARSEAAKSFRALGRIIVSTANRNAAEGPARRRGRRLLGARG